MPRSVAIRARAESHARRASDRGREGVDGERAGSQDDARPPGRERLGEREDGRWAKKTAIRRRRTPRCWARTSRRAPRSRWAASAPNARISIARCQSWTAVGRVHSTPAVATARPARPSAIWRSAAAQTTDTQMRRHETASRPRVIQGTWYRSSSRFPSCLREASYLASARSCALASRALVSSPVVNARSRHSRRRRVTAVQASLARAAQSAQRFVAWISRVVELSRFSTMRSPSASSSSRPRSVRLHQHEIGD